MANETSVTQSFDKKVALVIGNSYSGASRVSGIEDASGMAKYLTDLGFTVLDPIFDGDLGRMTSALASLREKIAQAEVVVFFYSGHGYQIQDKSYLLPVGASVNPQNPQLPLEEVLVSVSGAPDKAVKLLFLDACRSNASLPTVGGGKLGNVTGFSQGLSKPPAGVPPQTVIAYAADFGRAAVGGEIDGVSPYTSALLSSILEPGLEIRQLLTRVHDDVFKLTRRKQSPTAEGLTRIPATFYLRKPVEILATIDEADNDLFVFLNGEIVQTASRTPQKPLQLKAGDNSLVLMVAKGKSFHNNHDWSVTEGWHYKMRLKLPNGDEQVFEDPGEDHPFKAGPHHGAVFKVAQANLFVDPDAPQVSVVVRDPDFKVWQRETETPVWAQDQGLLFKEKITNLNLSPDDILGSAVNLGPLAPLLRPLLAEFLKTGTLFGAKIADPDRTFVTVRGNKKFMDVVDFCMTQQRDERIRDLKASIAAAFSRAARPFDVFDQGLIASIRAKAPSLGITDPPQDLLVWTALEEDQAAQPVSTGAPALGTQTLAAAAPENGVDETGSANDLTPLAQDALLHPRPDEALIGPSSFEQSVQGVPISAQVYTFLAIQPAADRLRFHARVVADLSDLQNKIGALIDTIPLPADNCSHFGVDNVVARIWGKQIKVSGNVATLQLNGDVDVWTCVKNPVPCTRVEWVDEQVPLLGTVRVPKIVTFDCNPPIKNRNVNQPFEATLPFSVAPLDSRTYALRLGDPAVNLGGALGGVTEGILRIAGVDVNARVREALEHAINPDMLKQTLPDFLLPLDPTLTREELVSNSGSLALALELDATLDFKDLGILIQRLFSLS